MQCTAATCWMLSRLLDLRGLEQAINIPVMVLLAFAAW